MIPKKIIYCWFGDNEISDFEKECMRSWGAICPDYEIIKIDESNFDVYQNEFCKEAYEHGNYAFVSDYARLWALKKYGGFYLDTDIKLFKSLDELRGYDAVIPLNSKGFYNCAPLACGKFVDILSEAYTKLRIGRCLNTTLNEICYQHYDLLGRELEVYDNIAFVGNHYFVTGGYEVNEETFGIHYCLGSWLDKWQGGYDKKTTFKAFEVYQDGVRDTKSEEKYFGGNEKIGKLYINNTPLTPDVILYGNGNYFYNNRVVRVIGKNFVFERYNAPTELEEIKVEDVVIQCAK